MINIPPQKLKEILVKEGIITAENFDDLSVQAKRMNQYVVDILISRSLITSDYFYNLIAKYFGVERVSLISRQIEESVLKRLSEELARQKRVIVFNIEADGTIDVAMEDPSNLETIEFLKTHLKANIKPFLASPEDLNRGFSFYGRHLTEDFKKIIEENIQATLRRKIGSIKEAAKDVPVVAIIDNLVSYAISLRASDVHIEVLESILLIRYRIDGILHEILKIPKEVYPAILARIKLLGGLKIDEHLKPQDGRFRYKLGPDIIDIRVAVIPVFYGEKVELRLLPSTQRPVSLAEIGMLEDTRKIVEENIKKTYGMVLVCGPTGSGKSTTLYSILNILNRPEVNIVTVEDPVEYDIQYVNQTQINPQAGISFANGLRAILRQDPNIILVGEIRDEETAEIAVNAALTGHLLLSSLHTNDAATAVPRLMDMGIEPFLVAAVLNVSVAQRLVRKICTNCLESNKIDAGLVSFLETQLKQVNPYSQIRVPRIFYKGKGCTDCGNTGYRGRLGIYEVLKIDEDLRKLIISPDFSLNNLNNLAKKNGMITMFEDGLRKATTAITTIDEVLRVIRE